MSSDDDQPLYLGLGACHELGAAGKHKRSRRKEPIGFVHFRSPKRRKAATAPERKPPPRRRRRSGR